MLKHSPVHPNCVNQLDIHGIHLTSYGQTVRQKKKLQEPHGEISILKMLGSIWMTFRPIFNAANPKQRINNKGLGRCMWKQLDSRQPIKVPTFYNEQIAKRFNRNHGVKPHRYNGDKVHVSGFHHSTNQWEPAVIYIRLGNFIQSVRQDSCAVKWHGNHTRGW